MPVKVMHPSPVVTAAAWPPEVALSTARAIFAPVLSETGDVPVIEVSDDPDFPPGTIYAARSSRS